jgi:hypothetical protein
MCVSQQAIPSTRYEVSFEREQDQIQFRSQYWSVLDRSCLFAFVNHSFDSMSMILPRGHVRLNGRFLWLPSVFGLPWANSFNIILDRVRLSPYDELKREFNWHGASSGRDESACRSVGTKQRPSGGLRPPVLRLTGCGYWSAPRPCDVLALTPVRTWCCSDSGRPELSNAVRNPTSLHSSNPRTCGFKHHEVQHHPDGTKWMTGRTLRVWVVGDEVCSASVALM